MDRYQHIFKQQKTYNNKGEKVISVVDLLKISAI